MGVGKKAAKHTVNKKANDVLDDMGAVGDVIDKHTSTGPLDKADDALDETKDNFGDDRDDRKKDRGRRDD